MIQMDCNSTVRALALFVITWGTKSAEDSKIGKGNGWCTLPLIPGTLDLSKSNCTQALV